MQARRVLGIITLALLLHVLQSREVFFAGTNLYYFVNVVYEDLAIADMSGVQSLLGSIDDCAYGNLADNNFCLR